VLLGREVAPGLRLVEVRRDGVTLEHDGARTQYDVPALSVAKSSSAAAMFRREGDTLTAPSQDVSSPGAKASGSVRSLVNSALLPASQAAPPVPPGGVGRLAPDETPMPGRPAQPGSNPPYIPTADLPELPREVRDFDPCVALDGGFDGLAAYQRIMPESRSLLARPGWLLAEFGARQTADVTVVAKQCGFNDTMTYKDLSGLDRVLAARLL